MEIIAWDNATIYTRTIQVWHGGRVYGKSVREIGSNWIKFLPRRSGGAFARLCY